MPSSEPPHLVVAVEHQRIGLLHAAAAPSTLRTGRTVVGPAGASLPQPMTRTPFDELVHRLNNLLSTIELQAELASSDGSLAAHREALGHIVESARRTQQDLARLRAQRGDGTT